MRVRYDRGADAAYLYLVDEIEGPVTTHCLERGTVAGTICLDFDASNRLVGIEVIPATDFLPAALLSEAR